MTTPMTETRDPESPTNRLVDVTILMPCLDEAATLPECIGMAQEAAQKLKTEGLETEILISDNGSTDGSIEIAEQLGCRVTSCLIRGYGSALIHGCKEALGRYIVMGDSDASYDFREGVPMILKLKEGYDFCMGSRFKGKILEGAMPWKNRYIGNPVLTGTLNLFYRSGLSDAHCGLRALSKEAFQRMQLEAHGMEFASEMVVKASLLGLKRTEVPITLHPDGRGRAPHLRPWRDGWRHLKFLLTLSPLWVYFIPAAVLLTAAVAVFSALLNTPPGQVFRFGNLWVGDHWLILAGGFATIGYQALLMGLASLTYTVEKGFRRTTSMFSLVTRITTVESLLLLGLALGTLGVGIIASVFVAWSGANFGTLAKTREMVLATTMIVGAFQSLFGGFLLSILRSND